MKKLEITIEGPYIEIKIDGIVQDQVKLVKLDAVVVNGVALSLKSLITPLNQVVPQPDIKKEPNGPEAKRS
jgi:hypothetical protein